MKVQWATNQYSSGIRVPHLETAAKPAVEGCLASQPVTAPASPSPVKIERTCDLFAGPVRCPQTGPVSHWHRLQGVASQ